MGHGLKPKTTPLWAIQCPGPHDPADPISGPGLTDLVPDKDWWSVRLSIFYHVLLDNNRSNKGDGLAACDAFQTFLVAPLFHLTDGVTLVVERDPRCFVFVQHSDQNFLGNRIDR